MLDLEKLVDAEIDNGYGELNARAKVCQDIVLKAISSGSLNRNITIKGGVVMRSKTGNIRRATQDMDLDFLLYSISDDSIDAFIQKLNSLEGIKIERNGKIVELKQQDYHGKRVNLLISDTFGNSIKSKLDLGVHKQLDVKQEEYCFDIAFDEEGASLLINSNEQMFTEKLRSLLRFGPVSTRYKDIFDMYFLMKNVEKENLLKCFDIFIFKDDDMLENNVHDITARIQRVFSDKRYIKSLEETDKKWIDEDVSVVTDGIIGFLKDLEK